MVVAVGVLATGTPSVAPAQTVTVDAPPSLHDAADRVRALPWDRLAEDLARAGLTLPATMHVTLVPEDAPEARETPRWVVGRAFGSSHIVVFPARTGRFPYGSLDAVMRHEVAHLALSDASGGGGLPRWFHEGVATSVEGGWSGADQVRLLVAVLTTPAIAEVDRLFASDAQPDATLAYSLAAAVIDDARDRHGASVPGRIARRVAAGVPFADAFVSATGDTPDQAAERAWSTFRWWTPLLALPASGHALWVGILVLAVIAFLVRRSRRAQQRARMDAEDEARDLDGFAEFDPTDGAGEDTNPTGPRQLLP